jgi:hypothetical protein
MRINFRLVSGAAFSLDLPGELTVAAAKPKIASQVPDSSPGPISLIWQSSILSDSATLSSLAIPPSEYVIVQWQKPAPTGYDNLPLTVGRHAGLPPLTPIIPEHVARLVADGFPEYEARLALRLCMGLPDAAVRLLGRARSGEPVTPAARLAYLLRRDPASFGGIALAVIRASPNGQAREFARDPALLLTELRLDPAQFDVETVKGAVMAHWLKPRLVAQFGDVEDELIDLAIEESGGDEETSIAMLRQMRGEI